MNTSQGYLTTQCVGFELHSVLLSAGYVKIENPEASCANFHSYSEKTVEAIFSVQGVRGSIKLSQPNPYKPTKLDVSLQVRKKLNLHETGNK